MSGEDRNPAETLATIIAGRVALEISGCNLRGACPSHPDGDRSFYVHRVRPIFHCFSCGISGDAQAWAALVSRL